MGVDLSLESMRIRSERFRVYLSVHKLFVCLLLIPALSQLHPGVDCYCDRVFQDHPNDYGSERATKMPFEAPIQLPANSYSVRHNATTGELTVSRPEEASTSRHRAMHCLYQFVARPGEKVALSFESSRMRGSEPDCSSEYVDIYVKLKSDENLEEAIGRELPNGRFCTAIVPHKLVSLYNMIVLSIYSDQQPLKNQSMFSGSYEFIRHQSQTTTAPNDQSIGPPDEGTLCSYTIYSSQRREGEFQSLTYPGVYAKDMHCSYKFIGRPQQRIRLEFLDLDLYSGGGHCPFDNVRVFDGLNETDPLIQLICGSHRSLIVYSTHEHLLVTFTALPRGAEVQNRGYSAYYEFSDKFVQPSFIQGPNARHIRGTECDQRIVSAKGSRGTIIAPDVGASSHPNAICRYFFEGLQSSHDYEKVLLKFVEFDLKAPQSKGSTSSGGPTSGSGRQQQVLQATTTTTTSSPIALLFQALSGGNLTQANQIGLTSTGANQPAQELNQSSGAQQTSNTTFQTDVCPDNYVRLYTGEQKPDQRQDPNEYDYVFCGNDVPAATIESDAASLLMEFNSGSLGGFFRAEYTFIVDFRITGYQITQLGCNYVYRSDLMKTGFFNSPRHPSWYINDMNCTFTFLTKPDEALLLQFNTFQMAKAFASNLTGYGEVCKNEDSVEVNEIMPLEGATVGGANVTSISIGGSNELKRFERHEIGTYCGLTTPGPILSYKPMLVNFRTNNDQVDYGFSATYHFHSLAELKTNEFVSNCGEQIHASSRNRNGTFSSPPTYRSETYEKRNHICVWNITARSNFRIALNFTRFEMEGSPAVRGCATAAVRLEMDRAKLPATELCGTLTAPGDSHQFVSRDEQLAVTFISTKQASGSNGFSAIWMEIKRTNVV